MQHTSVRHAETKDAPDLVRLLDQLGYEGSQPFITGKIDTMTREDDSGILVADLSGKVVGFLAYHFFTQLGLPGDFCRITYFCVDAEVRGSGVGKRLEETLAAMAVERGCDRMEVHCGDQRMDAHVFYRRLGYRESPKYFTKRVTSSRPG